MSAKSVTAARQKRKRELVYIMGGKCSICGYDKCIAALEFHHVNKSTKNRGLSDGNCYSWEKDVEEVKKCALVCSNCHKEIELLGLEVETSFDEKRFQEISSSKKSKRPNRENLKALIRNDSFTAIAQTFGVVENTIKKWCKHYNLPHKISEIELISDKDWELV